MSNSSLGFRRLFFSPMLSVKEEAEYKRLSSRLHQAVKKLGDYEPTIDDLLIDQAVRAKIYAVKCEKVLDRATQSAEIQGITDAVSKWNAALRRAINDLAANRRERLKSRSRREIVEELERFIEGEVESDRAGRFKEAR